MTARSHRRSSPRKLLLAAAATLTLAFAASHTARAAESAAGTKPATQAPAKPAAKPAATTVKKTTTKRSTSKRHVAPKRTSSKSKRRTRHYGDPLALQSSSVLVIDQETGETVAFKNPDVVLPIASLTKLMTALVVVESGAPMDELLEISAADIDTQRNSHSRLNVGTRLTRNEMLLLALMSSENRAANALGRHHPGGLDAFLLQMNVKAESLGMTSTHFADPAGLSNGSVSTARDLHRLVTAAYAQPLIRSYSTQQKGSVVAKGRTLNFINSNALVRKTGGDWEIELQKTGFTKEAGRCLVMQATVLSRKLAMIFLDSAGKLTRYGDAARVRKKLELEMKALKLHPPVVPAVGAAS